MQIQNTFSVPVPVDAAWDVLLDVERVAHCMPGATLESINGDEFAGQVKVKLGPISLSYRGAAKFLQRDPVACTAVIEARGRDVRGNGTAGAQVRMHLRQSGNSTIVTLDTELQITGRPAQLGRTLIADVGDQLIGQFAAALANQIEHNDMTPGETRTAAVSAASPSLVLVQTKQATDPAGVIRLLTRALGRRIWLAARDVLRRAMASLTGKLDQRSLSPHEAVHNTQPSPERLKTRSAGRPGS